MYDNDKKTINAERSFSNIKCFKNMTKEEDIDKIVVFTYSEIKKDQLLVQIEKESNSTKSHFIGE